MLMPRGHIYTKDQIITALTLYNNLQSMPKVVELLGYPSVSMLCEWKRMYPEMLKQTKRKKPRKWAQASFDCDGWFSQQYPHLRALDR